MRANTLIDGRVQGLFVCPLREALCRGCMGKAFLVLVMQDERKNLQSYCFPVKLKNFQRESLIVTQSQLEKILRVQKIITSFDCHHVMYIHEVPSKCCCSNPHCFSTQGSCSTCDKQALNKSASNQTAWNTASVLRADT